MKKFTMELVWHNCWECPPEETANDYLIATDGDDVYEAAWYAPDGFMIRNKHDGWWHGLYEDLGVWYWADIKQTVRREHRFKGLIVDDLANYLNGILSMKQGEHWTLKDGLLYKDGDLE